MEALKEFEASVDFLYAPKMSRISSLRAATTTQHQELDGLIRLMDENVQKSYYAKILSLFFGFVSSFEASLFSHPEWLSNLPEIARRKKSDKLRADLEQLDINPIHLPVNQNPPPTREFAEALGVMYVMEGSTLGGQMMTKHLAKKFPELSHHYMRGYESETGKMWQQFLAALEKFELSSDEEEKMKKAAQATFTSLKNWFVEGLRSK